MAYKLRFARTSTLKMKVGTRIPAQLVAGDGITITKANGVYTFDVSTEEIQNIVDAAIAEQTFPIASQLEAEDGTTNVKTITPLRLTQHAKATGEYSLRWFGPIPDSTSTASETANVAALEALFAEVNGQTTYGSEDSRPPSWQLPRAEIPGGCAYFLNGPITTLLPRHVHGVGYPRLIMDASLTTTDMFNGVGLTRLDMKDLVLVNSRHQIVLSNANINFSRITIDNVEFIQSADQALYVSSAYSTTMLVRNCGFRECNGDIYTETDLTTIDGGWSQPDLSNFTEDRAVITMGHLDYRDSYLNMINNWCGVPVLYNGDPDILFNVRWVDVRGQFRANGVRFGGEFGGIPICHSFTPYDTSGARRGGVIDIQNCLCSAGPEAVTYGGAIVLRLHLPRVINWQGNDGPFGGPIIRNPGFAPIDLSTYFDAWRTAIGDATAKEEDYFRWYIDDQGANIGSTPLWPSEITHIIRTPSKIMTSRAYAGAAQSLPGGSTISVINLDTISFDPGKLFSASDKGFKIKQAGYYRANGMIQSTATAAGDTLHAFIAVNGTAKNYGQRDTATGAVAHTSVVSALMKLAVGDIVTLKVLKAVGAENITVASSTNYLEIVGPLRHSD